MYIVLLVSLNCQFQVSPNVYLVYIVLLVSLDCQFPVSPNVYRCVPSVAGVTGLSVPGLLLTFILCT